MAEPYRLKINWTNQLSVYTDPQGYIPEFFSGSDQKLQSTQLGHSGHSSEFFNIFDIPGLAVLNPGTIPGGPVLAKYADLSLSTPALPPGAFAPSTAIDYVRQSLKQSEVVNGVLSYQKCVTDRAAKGHGPPDRRGPWHNITKGEPLLFLGAKHTMATPIHNNIGIVTNRMKEPTQACDELDAKTGPLSLQVRNRLQSARLQVQAATDKVNRVIEDLRGTITEVRGLINLVDGLKAQLYNSASDGYA